MRQAVGPRKLRQVSRRFGREVTEVLVRGGSPHGCGWARFAGEPAQVWVNYALGEYLDPNTGAVLGSLAEAAAAATASPALPHPPSPAEQALVDAILVGLLDRLGR